MTFIHIEANYRVADETDHHIILQDIGPHDQYKTITNAAEWVVKQMVPRLKGRKLYYTDSLGQVDELLIHDGRFAGFASGGPVQHIVEIRPNVHDPDKVYFGVTIDRQRAEYLRKCLNEPLCKHCGLEKAECEADPCAAAQHEYDAYVDPAEYRGADYEED